jgi:hypothetical protein
MFFAGNQNLVVVPIPDDRRCSKRRRINYVTGPGSAHVRWRPAEAVAGPAEIVGRHEHPLHQSHVQPLGSTADCRRRAIFVGLVLALGASDRENFRNSGRRWCASPLQREPAASQDRKVVCEVCRAHNRFGLWVWRRKFVERIATGQVLGHEDLLMVCQRCCLVAGLMPYKFDDKALAPHRSAREEDGAAHSAQPQSSTQPKASDL